MVVKEKILVMLRTENFDQSLKKFSQTTIIKLSTNQSEVSALPARLKIHPREFCLDISDQVPARAG